MSIHDHSMKFLARWVESMRNARPLEDGQSLGGGQAGDEEGGMGGGERCGDCGRLVHGEEDPSIGQGYDKVDKLGEGRGGEVDMVEDESQGEAFIDQGGAEIGECRGALIRGQGWSRHPGDFSPVEASSADLVLQTAMERSGECRRTRLNCAEVVADGGRMKKGMPR